MGKHSGSGGSFGWVEMEERVIKSLVCMISSSLRKSGEQQLVEYLLRLQCENKLWYDCTDDTAEEANIQVILDH